MRLRKAGVYFSIKLAAWSAIGGAERLLAGHPVWKRKDASSKPITSIGYSTLYARADLFWVDFMGRAPESGIDGG